MGRGPTNENTNMYFQARKKAATYNERLWSREGAAELLGISVSTLADYELGNTKVVPVDKVVLMADLYNAPELITGYCMRECPVHGFLPLATEEKSLEGIALRLLQNFNEDSLKNMRDSLIEITADGKITKDELPALEKIIGQLEKMAEVISEMKIAGEKYLNNERLWSREGAAELLGISVSTLADYELGNTKVVPVDKVVLMADLYNAPELITGYCMRECPVHGFLPLATEEKSLEGIALRLLQNFNEDSLKNMRDSLIEITADGKITKDELPALEKIIGQLEKMAEVISEMKIAGEKYLNGK